MTTDRPAAIEFLNVNKTFGDLHVVRDLSLRIEEGEFVTFLGPSGCGKSTILKLICGIEDLTDGEIHVDGKLVNYLPPRDRNVAMVFQDYALYPHMTVARNIAYPLTTGGRHSVRASERESLVIEVARMVEVDTQLQKYPDQLSGGQRQRVALARAIIRKPIAYLMDEPLSNLDAKLREAMRTQLMELHRKVGRANLYVTHDQVEAMTMSDRIVVLNDGVIQQVAHPRELFEAPANLFVAQFIGSPQMNLAPGVLAAGGRVRMGGIDIAHRFASGQAAQAVTVGLRPTDLRAAANGDGLNQLTGRVAATSYTGSDLVYDLEIEGGIRLTVRGAGDSPILPGQSQSVAIAPDRVHLFDETGRRL